MFVPIPTVDARQQRLPGADTFRFSHLLYLDDLHRDFGVVHLHTEACKAFGDTVTVSQRFKLAAEHRAIETWQQAGGDSSGVVFPWPDTMGTQTEFINYENLKIAAGFELYLKARLLARDFVIHELDPANPPYRSLANDQKRRPIAKAELFAISSFMFNGELNYLPGLRDSSLKFSTLTTVPSYETALALPAGILRVINDYRTLRNQIHLPGDLIRTRHVDALGNKLPEVLADFVNAEVVQVANDLIARHPTFNRRLLESI